MIMIKKIFLLLSFVFSISCYDQIDTESDGIDTDSDMEGQEKSWELVWHDEFNGSELDDSKWMVQSGAGPWGLEELQYYTEGNFNIAVSDGFLVLEARKENYGGKEYTSARIMTPQSFGLGRYEARIKLPWGRGMFPAFWTLTESYSLPGEYGEIDIMEMVGSEAGTENATIWGSAHRSDPDNPPDGLHSVSDYYTTPDLAWFNDGFHVFSVEKWIDRLLFFVDDNLFFSVPMNVDGSDGFDNLQAKPAWIILNLAIGGDWAGEPDGSTVWPQQMVVDYVRYYEYK